MKISIGNKIMLADANCPIEDRGDLDKIELHNVKGGVWEAELSKIPKSNEHQNHDTHILILSSDGVDIFGEGIKREYVDGPDIMSGTLGIFDNDYYHRYHTDDIVDNKWFGGAMKQLYRSTSGIAEIDNDCLLVKTTEKDIYCRTKVYKDKDGLICGIVMSV